MAEIDLQKLNDIGHARVVGREVVHLINAETVKFEYMTAMCGVKIDPINSDLTKDYVSCPRCIQLINAKKLIDAEANDAR